jgi:LysM repeat protein
MCGHDLRTPQKRARRVSLIDVLLVVAVVAVLVFWWRVASQPQQESATADSGSQLMPTNIPLMTATAVVSGTVQADADATPTLPPPTPEERADGALEHTVRGGETLLGIAGLYGVTVEEIQAANGLASVLIRPGDVLIIPIEASASDAPISQVASQFEYTVQAGDTVVSMAARFGSTVQDILQANGLTDNALIRPGDVLVVPVRQVPSQVLASSSDAAPAPTTVSGGRVAAAQAETVYIAPRLIGPPNGATLPKEESVLLRWISVDVLDSNEWYVLLLYPVSGSAQNIPSIWTKSTSYRLATDLAPAEGESAEYAWQVSVVRVQSGVSSQYALDAASPPSELRTFTWN